MWMLLGCMDGCNWLFARQTIMGHEPQKVKSYTGFAIPNLGPLTREMLCEYGDERQNWRGGPAVDGKDRGRGLEVISPSRFYFPLIIPAHSGSMTKGLCLLLCDAPGWLTCSSPFHFHGFST